MEPQIFLLSKTITALAKHSFGVRVTVKPKDNTLQLTLRSDGESFEETIEVTDKQLSLAEYSYDYREELATQILKDFFPPFSDCFAVKDPFSAAEWAEYKLII